MKLIATLRHWLVFSLLFVLPFAGLLIFRLILTFKGDELNLQPLLLIGPVSAVLISYIFITSFVWVYGTGVYLHSRLPEGIFLNLPIFRFMTIAPLLWGFWYAYIMLRFFSYTSGGVISDDSLGTFGLAAIVAGLFCLHNLWFIAKCLRSVEAGGEVNLGAYIGDFFLLLFLPIGIWILQPRINRIAGTEEPEDDRPDILDTHFR